MRPLLLFMLLFGLFLCTRHGGCHILGIGGVRGSGPTKTEYRDLGQFKHLTVDISGDVTVEPAENFRAEVSAQENLLPILKTEVDGETLHIHFEKSVWSSGDVNIKLYVPNLENVEVNGSGDVQIHAPQKGENLDLSISGSGSIRSDKIAAAKIRCDIGGSGEAQLAGTANEFDVNISGSGDVDALNLMTQDAEADISGSGTVRVFADQNLRANVSGSGDVFYKGNAAVHSSTSGSGEISKI